jgi:hypothetical protein
MRVSALQDEVITQQQLDEICAAAVEESKGGASTVLCLLRAKAKFTQLCSVPGAVAFAGVDSGRLEVVVKAQKPNDPPYLSGMSRAGMHEGDLAAAWGCQIQNNNSRAKNAFA